MKIVVYTAIFGNRDKLWPPFVPAMDDAQFVCFSDKPLKEYGLWNRRKLIHRKARTPGGPFWEARQVKAEFGPRKTARYYKALSHKWFPDADVTIWLDGNLRLLIPPGRAVEKWLKKNDLAAFNHPDRNCLYAEAEFCAQKGKGNRATLTRQAARYRADGMPPGWGLPETRCVIRRNTSSVNLLNAAWWGEMERGSVRDQVSLPYLCWKADSVFKTHNLGSMKWNVIPGRAWVSGKRVNKDFWFTRH